MSSATAPTAQPGPMDESNGSGRLHVFIAGVSWYANLPGANDPMPASAFGLRRLSSPALSGFRLYRWLQEHHADLPLPLGHCSLLLSPSDEEMVAEPQLAAAKATNQFAPATLDHFLDAAEKWRQAAAGNRNDMTWFYFAGHGMQRSKNDAVFLLEGFGKPTGGALRDAVDLNTLYNGMAPSPSRSEIARRQVYFVDACRLPFAEFQKLEAQTPTQVFQVELSGVDDRQAPLFFATVSGDIALGFNGRPSFFNQTLLNCLDGAAGEPIEDQFGNIAWQVTSHSLTKAMNVFMGDWKAAGIDQTFAASGQVQTAVALRRLKGPPPVDVSIAIAPDTALPFAKLVVSDAATLTSLSLPMPLQPNPFFASWPAGTYRIDVQLPPHPLYRSPPTLVSPLLPPRRLLVRKVTP